MSFLLEIEVRDLVGCFYSAMKTSANKESQAPFEFVLDELLPIRPVIKQMFGFGYIFVGDKLMLLLRNRVNQTRFNGVWVATTEEHFKSLQKEFPISPAWLVSFAKKQWLLIPLNAEDFEEYSLKACELILRGDVRLGRLSTPKKFGGTKKKQSSEKGDEPFSLFSRSGKKTKEQT